MGDQLNVKDRMIFMGFSEKNTTIDILAPVIGIVKYKALNKFLGFFNLIDIESFRECFGYLTASDKERAIKKETQAILEMGETDLNRLFASEPMIEREKPTQKVYDTAFLKKETEKKEKIDVDQGAYNQIYIKLAPRISLTDGLNRLNRALKGTGLNVRAITWKEGMGEVADLAMIMKGALFIFVMFIFFVAVIIIMNTLSMAAIERVSEIGMMRAVGARKSFVSWMFLLETSLLAFAFGGAGIVAGWIAVLILSAMNLSTVNEMLQLFYGGNAFRPHLEMADIIVAILQLAFVTLLSTLYPIFLTRKITPQDAISRE